MVLCPCLFLCFDFAGHMLLWARIFFSKELVVWGTLVFCVLGLREGDYGGIYRTMLTCSFRQCQCLRSSKSCNFLHCVLWRWMFGWCKWGSGYVWGFLWLVIFLLLCSWARGSVASAWWQVCLCCILNGPKALYCWNADLRAWKNIIVYHPLCQLLDVRPLLADFLFCKTLIVSFVFLAKLLEIHEDRALGEFSHFFRIL